MPAKAPQATTVQVKTVFVILAGIVTVVAGITAAVALFPLLLTAAVCLPLLVALGALTHRHAHRSPRFSAFTIDGKNLLVIMVLTGGALHAAWILAANSRPSPSGWVFLAIGLPTLAWVEYVVARWQDGLTKHPRAATGPAPGAELARRPGPEQQQLVPVAEVLDAELVDDAPALPAHILQVLRQEWIAMMRNALNYTEDFAYLEVTDVRRVSDYCLVFTVFTPPKAVVQLAAQEEAQREAERTGGKAAPVKATMTAFGPHAAEALAGAVGWTTRKLIPRDWVEVIEHEYAGMHEVTVLSGNVMADVIPYLDTTDWASIDDPCPVGRHTNGVRAVIKLTGHGRIVAKSESGKTNLLYVLMLYVMRCHDAIPLACGRRKMNQTFYQLLMDYMGTEYRLPIRVAVGQLHTVHMLWSLLMQMEYRQNLDPDELEKLPAIVLFMDEATDILDDATVTVEYHGREIDASEAVYMLQRGAKSARIYLVLVTHRGVNHSMGNEGGDIKAGFDWQAAMMTNDPDDIARMFGDHKLPRLKYAGELLLAPTGHAARRTKIEYVQEVNKRNAPKTSGTTVPQAGFARARHAAERWLDRGTERAGGQPFADLHTHMTPAFLEYLRGGPQKPVDASTGGAPGAEQDGGLAAPQAPSEAESKGLKKGREDALKIMREMGLTPPGFDPDSPAQASADTIPTGPAEAPLAAPASNVTSIKQPTWPELIMRVLAEHGALPSSRIIELLAQHRPVTNKNAIYNALGAMDGQQITKRADGTYAAA